VAVWFVTALLPVVCLLLIPLLDAWRAHEGVRGWLLSARQWALLARSLKVALATTAVSLGLGVPVGFLLARTDLWARRQFAWLCALPLLIPPYIHAIAWQHLGTALNRAAVVNAVGGVVWVLALAYFPFVALLAASGLRGIDRHLEEASLLHQSAAQTIFRITLPLALPYICSGAVLVFIFSLIDFTVPDILRVNVYPIEIFIEYSALYHERTAILMTLPLVALTLALLTAQKWYFGDRSVVQSGGSAPYVYSLGAQHLPAAAYCASVIALAAGTPLAVLIRTAGGWANYVEALRHSYESLGYSLALSAAGALATVVIAFFLVYAIVRHPSRWSRVLYWCTLVPLAIPATATGIGLIVVWNHAWGQLVYGTSAIVVIAYAARFIPFAVVALEAGLRQIPAQLEEAAMCVTPSWVRVARQILVPLLRPHLLASLCLVAIFSFGDLATTLLVLPPGRETLPMRMYNLMHYGAHQLVAALCLVVIGIIGLMAGGGWWAWSRTK